MKKALYFCHYWPREHASAACERLFSLANVLTDFGYQITFITSARFEHILSRDMRSFTFIQCLSLDPNDPPKVSKFFADFKNQPEVALFDTFISEEYYSHYVYRLFPDCLRILDTQDLHFLRKHRQSIYEKEKKQAELSEFQILSKVLPAFPELENKHFSREVLSIYRSDLSIVTSDYEQLLLEQRLGVRAVKLPFFYLSENFKTSQFQDLFVNIKEERNSKYATDKSMNFDANISAIASKEIFLKKKNFFFIGNYQHQPNQQAVRTLIKLWPHIQKRLPDAELHVYGSDFPKEFDSIEQYKGVKRGKHMKSIESIYLYRLLLAPLIFGAGVKGLDNQQDK